MVTCISCSEQAHSHGWPSRHATGRQILFCDRPQPPPMGYVYDGLAVDCARGYAGSATGRCLGGTRETQCVAPPLAAWRDEI